MPQATATSSAGVNSPFLDFVASAYSSATSSAIPQNFAWQVIPTGNDTATPSANLALEFSTGTATPAATGLSISPKGLINWATGQTFPITGITTSSPLTGSGDSGSVALGLNTGLLLPAITPPLETTLDTIYPQLNAENSFTNNNSFVGTINSLGTLDLEANGVTSAFAPNLNSALLELSANGYNSSEDAPEALNFGWQSVATGGNTASPSANLELLFGSGSTQPAATGLSIAPSGIINFASGQTFPGGGGGGGSITGITTSSPLTGSGTSGSVNLGLNTSAIETTLDAVYPQLTAANTFGYTQTVSTSATTAIDAIASGTESTGVVASGTYVGVNGTGYIGVQAIGTSYGLSASSTLAGGMGVSSDDASETGVGVVGASGALPSVQPGTGVQATGPNYGVVATSGGGVGVYGSGVTGVKAYGTSYGVSSNSTGVGGAGVSSYDGTGTGVGVLGGSLALPAVQAGTGVQGTGPNYGVFGEASDDTGVGVAGYSYDVDVGTGVYGNGDYGVWGFSRSDIGVLGQFYTMSQTFEGLGSVEAGVWGDTGEPDNTLYPTLTFSGIAGTADNAFAGVFYNNSATLSTILASNTSGGPTGLFTTLMATSPDGTCGFGSGGSLRCTGQLVAMTAAGGGERKVETYSVQSPENWMEDFGSGELQKGVAVVKIDPAFAETVSETADYHVFLTPNADSKGLYVINKTLTSFEVRESSGGTSSLAFDYRIVAKRRGYEAQRLVDVTERFNAEQARAMPPKGSGAPLSPRPQRHSLISPGEPATHETHPVPAALPIQGTPRTHETPIALPLIHPPAPKVGASHQEPVTHP